MATEDLNPASANAHGDELPPMMPLGQPGAHGGNPDADAQWLASQAMSTTGGPTHLDQNYAGMTHNPPGSGTHAAHAYDDYKHQGRE